jgi:predicted nucleotidyltransferase
MKRLYIMGSENRADLMGQMREELLSEQEVVFAYLYGSFVEEDAFHDVDVGIYLKSVKPGKATTMALALAQRLSERVRLPVDVRILNLAPVSFLYHVLRGRMILSRDSAHLAEVIEHTARRYLDLAPLLRQGAKEAFAA